MLQNPVGYTLMQIGTSRKITWFKGGRRKMLLKDFLQHPGLEWWFSVLCSLLLLHDISIKLRKVVISISTKVTSNCNFTVSCK